MTPLRRHSRLVIAVLMLLLTTAARAAEPESDAPDDLLLLPELEFEIEPGGSLLERGSLRAANESYSLLNETVSDAWNITVSPVDWQAREWLLLLGVAGTTTGLIYLADKDVREAALDNGHFQHFGDEIQAFGRGPALLAITGGFLLSGMIYSDKEIETAKMLIEASVISQGYSTFLKHAIGRKRPGPFGPRYFKPWSDEFSLPSGEVTNAFTIAAVIGEQYPSWPVRFFSYGIAATVGAGRIATDDHWASDVFVGAALGIFVGRSVTYFHKERAKRADERKRLGLEKDAYRARHFFAVSTRGFRWTVQF